MNERMIHLSTVDLCLETFGDRAHPPILLIAGAASSMLTWDAEFCRRLAGAGRYVIRYDQRDTGRSTCDPPGQPSYTQPDLVSETLALLDALDLPRAHLFGMSMGAGIAQLAALDHPGRIASIILTGATPGGPGPSYDDLPAPTEALRRAFAEEPPEPDWSDRDAVINYLVEGERDYAGSVGFDEQGWTEIAARTFDRATNIASLTNHFLAGDGPAWRDRLGTLAVPTLVLQGADDPLLPGHGEILAKEVPDAKLIMLDGVGHETPPRASWDTVITEVIAFTGGALP